MVSVFCWGVYTPVLMFRHKDPGEIRDFADISYLTLNAFWGI